VNTSKSSEIRDVDAAVPRSLRVAAAVGWRVLVVVGLLYVLGMVLDTLRLVVVPVAIALLLSALLAPAVAHLVRQRVPRGVATAVVLIGGIALVGGVLTFVVNAFIAGLPDLQTEVGNSLSTIRNWLVNGPFHLRLDQVYGALNNFLGQFKNNVGKLTSGALSTATTVADMLAGFLLMLFTLIFFLYDGGGIWKFLTRMLPTDVRGKADAAGKRSFATLVSYVRGTALVAVVDAVSIGVGLVIMGIPLAVPLAALVFLGAFVPIIGALLSGLVAVLVALVAKGFVPALLVLLLLVLVEQVEGHVLQPLLLGRAVRLHPLAVVLAIGAGVVINGIFGALLAVPLVAVLNSAVRSFVGMPTGEAEPAKRKRHSKSPPPEESEREPE
jgi:predicted PurR-regulated permease PerM